LRGRGFTIIQAMLNGLTYILGKNAIAAAQGLVLDRDPGKRFYLKVKSR